MKTPSESKLESLAISQWRAQCSEDWLRVTAVMHGASWMSELQEKETSEFLVNLAWTRYHMANDEGRP